MENGSGETPAVIPGAAHRGGRRARGKNNGDPSQYSTSRYFAIDGARPRINHSAFYPSGYKGAPSISAKTRSFKMRPRRCIPGRDEYREEISRGDINSWKSGTRLIRARGNVKFGVSIRKDQNRAGPRLIPARTRPRIWTRVELKGIRLKFVLPPVEEP